MGCLPLFSTGDSDFAGPSNHKAQTEMVLPCPCAVQRLQRGIREVDLQTQTQQWGHLFDFYYSKATGWGDGGLLMFVLGYGGTN